LHVQRRVYATYGTEDLANRTSDQSRNLAQGRINACHSSLLQMDLSDRYPFILHGGSLDPEWVISTNSISIRSLIFAQLIHVINTQTHRLWYVRHLQQ